MLRIARVVAASLVLLVVTITIAPADAAPGRGGKSDEALSYWTAERAARATPRDLVVDPGNGRVALRPKPDNPGRGNGNGGGDDGGEQTGGRSVSVE